MINDRSEKSIGANAIFSMVRTFLSIVFPLITFPYASRVLHAENLGKVNYIASIISYFGLLAGLGFYTYGVREGAKLKGKQQEFNRLISQIVSMNLLMTILSYLLLFSLVISVPDLRQYWLLFLIQGLSVLFTTIGVEWINVIYEDYSYITIRSIVVQILSLVCLLIFVKNPSDYYIYALITVLANGVVGLMNIVHVRKYCCCSLTLKMNIRKHIKPVMVLFANNIAVSIYLNSDTTMLGAMVGDFYVGLYSVAVKVYSIVKQVIAAFYSVILSRMSTYYAEEKVDEFKKLLNQVICIIVFVSVPATIGMLLISDELVMLLFGYEYFDASHALQILSVAIFFAIIGGALANAVNIPMGKERNNLIATSISAVTNIVLNIFLIPRFKHVGASITTLISEFTVFAILIIGLRKNFDLFSLRTIRTTLLKSLFSSLPMIVLFYINKVFFRLSGLIFVIPMVFISAMLYALFSCLFKNEGIKMLISSFITSNKEKKSK